MLGSCTRTSPRDLAVGIAAESIAAPCLMPDVPATMIDKQINDARSTRRAARVNLTQLIKFKLPVNLKLG